MDGLSFTVRRGEVFGLLAPNGAGKTSTVGVLTTRVRPTSGQALVDGVDVVADSNRARQNLLFHAAYHGIGPSERKKLADDILERMGCEAVRPRRHRRPRQAAHPRHAEELTKSLPDGNTVSVTVSPNGHAVAKITKGLSEVDGVQRVEEVGACRALTPSRRLAQRLVQLRARSAATTSAGTTAGLAGCQVCGACVRP